jgi:hypothetical protein
LASDRVGAILEQLRRVGFTEHNVLTYPDIHSFRQVYSRFAKEKLQANEAVAILPYYDTIYNIKHFLGELEIDVIKQEIEGGLLVLDSLKAFYSSEINLPAVLAAFEGTAKLLSKRTGISVIIDMGAFFHFDENEASKLVNFEASVSTTHDLKCKSLLCCYHQKDLKKIPKAQQDMIFEKHHRRIILS